MEVFVNRRLRSIAEEPAPLPVDSEGDWLWLSDEPDEDPAILLPYSLSG